MAFQPERCKPNVLERFWTHVDRSGTCWTWIGGKTPDGYGLFKAHTGFQMYAHRFIDIYMNGPHAADTPFTLHICDNPACVRPSHLSRGNNADNMTDMYRKGRGSKAGERNGYAKLTNRNVLDIRASSQSTAALAKTYGVGRHAIWEVRRRRTWKEYRP